MARQPVTRMQLDAYRFGQRRLESALARRDPVLLHEVIRGQRRTVAVGLVLATLLGLGLVGYRRLVGTPDWAAQQIIQAGRSGQMYVVIHQGPRSKLVPVPNLVAAKLVHQAASAPGASVASGGGASGSGAGSSEVRTMDDAALRDAERTAPADLPGAPGAGLPTSDEPAPPPPGAWALCDTGGGATLLVAGVAASTPLTDQDGVLLSSGGLSYLVTGGRKYLIGSPSALQAYDLEDATARPTSAGLLALIPDGPRLDSRTLPAVARPRSSGVGRQQPGDVVRVDRPGQARRFYLVLPGGVTELAQPVADLYRAGGGDDLSSPPASMTVGEVNALRRVRLPGVEAFPSVRPVIRAGAGARVVCWRWAPGGGSGSVTVAPAPPVPAGRATTALARSDGAGPELDEVSLPGGAALAAVPVLPGGSVGGGYWLVSEAGVAYPIRDVETRRALGLTSAAPVPLDALRALPQGPRLDLADAERALDALRGTPPPGR